MQKIRKAVIPAAGFGTRFLPETKAIPKEMLPIVDKPTIQYIVEEIKASGIEQILIISGHAKRAIEDHFDSSPELEEHLYESGKMDLLKEVRKVASVKIHYTRQPYMRGLGDAILCAKDFIDDEPFGVILGDDVVYFGTRFLPETKAIPKEMLPIVDKPTIQYIVEEIKASGIEQILIISGHAKRAIEDHFDSSPELEEHLYESGKMDLLKEVRKVASVKIHYTRQPYMRGLGDAILCAKDFIDDEPFGVILGDDVVYNGNETPALKQLMDQYQKTGATIIGCQIVPKSAVSSYGIVNGVPTEDPNLVHVKDMIEKPSIEEAPSQFAALGRYVITPDIFEILEQTKPGKGGEIQLTDALRVMAHDGHVYAYNFTGKRYDTGNKLGYLKATVEFALRREDLGEDFKNYLKTLVANMD